MADSVSWRTLMGYPSCARNRPCILPSPSPFHYIMAKIVPVVQLAAHAKSSTLYGCTVVRSYGHTVVRSYGRTVVRSYGRTVLQSYGRTVVRSYGRTVVRSYCRMVVQPNFFNLMGYYYFI